MEVKGRRRPLDPSLKKTEKEDCTWQMSDPFAHNSNYPGASAGRGRRPPTTSKPNPNNGQPDWFNSMEQTPPPNAISAVAPQTTASSNNNGRRIGEGKPRPPSKAKPPKQSTGPGSTAFGSRLTIGGRNNNNSQSYPTTNSTNAFPSAAASASMPAQTQYTNNTRNRDNNAYGAASYTAPSQPKQPKPAQQPPQQQQPPPQQQQQQQQPPQQQFNQQHSYQQPPSSSQSYSSGPGMFNPSMPPAVLSGKMGEPVNHNAALAAAALPTQQQQQQHSLSSLPPSATPNAAPQQQSTNNFSASSGVVPGNFAPPPPATMSGSMGSNNGPVPQFQGIYDFSDEPPLLEELGVDMRRILSKTLAVVNPFKKIDTAVMTAQDSDLVGPVIFAISLGALLMFQGNPPSFLFLFSSCFIWLPIQVQLISLVFVCCFVFHVFVFSRFH